MHISKLEQFVRPTDSGAKPGFYKRHAAKLLGIELGNALSKADEREIVAKANKIKDSKKKTERNISHRLIHFLPNLEE